MKSSVSCNNTIPDMMHLAIETATECCSVALYVDGEVISEDETAPQRHNEAVLPMCERVLARAQVSLAQLDAIAFGRGPGAFTGVRLAASVAQGIALARDLPVIPVSSLAALAQAACVRLKVSQVLTCMDARMQEVYFALYQSDEHDIMQLMGREQVGSPGLIDVDVEAHCVGCGSGWKVYAEELLERCGKEIAFDAAALPQAEYVAILAKHYFDQGKAVSATEVIPVYVRDDVATRPKSKTVR